MRVGIFCDCYEPQINGVVTSVLLLREELMRQGHDVYIVTVKTYNESNYDNNSNYTGANDYCQKEKVLRIPSIPFSKWNEFRLAIPYSLKYKKIVAAWNLDIIHIHTEFTIGMLGKRLAKKLSIPVVHTYHTMYEDYTHYLIAGNTAKKILQPLIRKYSKWWLQNANAIIAPSMKTRKALISYGLKEEDTQCDKTNIIHVIATGMNINNLHRLPKTEPEIVDIYKQHGIENDDKIILSLGRLSQEKSVEKIIEQIPLLAKILPVKLLIVGDGPYREYLQKLVLELDIQRNVIFIGKVPHEHIKYYYSLADVFISASKSETQGLTIYEAMANKLPIVIYNDDNIKDTIIHTRHGRLFNDETDMFEQIFSALNEKNASLLMAEEAFRLVNSFSQDIYGRSVLSVYEQVVLESTQALRATTLDSTLA